MLSKKVFVLLIAVVVIAVLVLQTKTINSQDSIAQSIKALHVFNIAQANEKQYLNIMSEFTELFKKLGHPEIKYQVWKELEGRNGEYKYVQESTWPDQATYDKVHNAPEYKKLVEKYSDEWAKLGIEQVYNRYSPLN